MLSASKQKMNVYLFKNSEESGLLGFAISSEVYQLKSQTIFSEANKDFFQYHLIIFKSSRSKIKVTIVYAVRTNEPRRQKMYLRRCSPSADSDQPGHSCGLTRIFTERILDSQGCKVSTCYNEDCDKTARIHRLIRVFVGRTYQKVRFLTLRLKCCTKRLTSNI